ncbi:MAG: CehA/McbA family metallohydrolase [Pirellulaceae bacterium]|nr:CehA/McbA family metallohydrolase [Pirellulaceae bacterium]
MSFQAIAAEPVTLPAGWPQVTGVEAQPLVASVKRLISAMNLAGSPLDAALTEELEKGMASPDAEAVAARVQQLLDPLCLAAVSINPESRVKVVAPQARQELVQHGWRTFLIKIHNEAGVTAPLGVSSPQAQTFLRRSSGSPEPKQNISSADVRDRWLELAVLIKQPLVPTLSGLPLEYRLIQLYSRDAGQREATLAFDVGQGTQDLGFRNEAPLQFLCKPASEIRLSIRDTDGSPTTAALLVTDAQGRVYPNPARRLAPDFFFHPQVYRQDGETLDLPPGHYYVTATRGPEYLAYKTEIDVVAGKAAEPIVVKLERWIDPTQRGWFSGDHHVHAAGCAHYEQPTEGVKPDDMLRHILGEDLKVGCVLSWGPCWYYQKQFFEGRTSDLSKRDYLMRYDVEVSGFPSSHAGHLCLLRLSEDDYPGTERIEQWPSWTLPVLKWGQQQGGVVGYSHSGWGLALPDYLPNGTRAPTPGGKNEFGPRSGGKAAYKLPDLAMPAFDGIGANEFIVTVAHDACDFISAVDTPAIWELNIWYHTLNSGFRTRISGETDFPCIYGERVGLGRIYVQLDEGQPLTYEHWVKGLKHGRSYCGDGQSHVLKFEINGTALGAAGAGGEASTSELLIDKPSKVTVKADVAALLDAEPSAEGRAIGQRRLDEKPYWHLERCRIDGSRRVPVELIVNGQVAQRQEIEADGTVQELTWEIELTQSSWVALRILPSVHTNPIFVVVDGKPVRPSLASAQWCRQAVDVCWERKRNQIRESEREAAAAAYQQAREIYERRMQESVGP